MTHLTAIFDIHREQAEMGVWKLNLSGKKCKRVAI